MSPYRTVGKWVNPPEAGPIAEQFRVAADEIRAICHRVKCAGARLDTGWIGHARDSFFSRFDSSPGELDNLASMLEDQANRIAGLQVWVEEEVWFDEATHGGGGSW